MAALVSPRPIGSPAAAAASTAGTAAAWPPAYSAASAVCASPALLLLQRDLLRAVQLPSLERAIEEWHAHFDTLERIVASIETALPRWRTLLAAQAALDQQRQLTEQQQWQQQRAAAVLPAVYDTFYLSAPLALDASSAATPSSSADAATPAEVLARVGVLACMPGHVASLARAQGNKLELAVKLLAGVHVEISTSYTQLIALLDAPAEVFEVHKKHFTPSQLALWCSATSPGMAPAAGAGEGGAVASGKKLTPASAAKGGAAGSAKAGSKEKEEAAAPASNSVTNILRRVRQMEELLSAQFDRHNLVWSAWHRALEQAGKPQDVAEAFELRRGQGAISPSGAKADAAAVTTTLAAGWMHVSPEDLLSRWREGHDGVEGIKSSMQDTLRRLQGRAPRELTAAATWAAAKSEQSADG